MTGDTYEQGIVALACWREMRGDLYTGMVSVGLVLRNRSLAGWHNGSIYNNAIAIDQLSSMSVKGDPNTIQYPDSREPQFQKLMQAMEPLFDNTLADITQGAMYYAALKYANSGWFFENIVSQPDKHPKILQIGQTTFFK